MEPIYANSFEILSQMQVERGADGGTITSLNSNHTKYTKDELR